MPVSRCRICGGVFFAPLLHYEDMPKAAQFLPDEADLAHETGADLDVVQCSACGLVQLDNDPVPYYREVIRASAVSDEMRRFRLEQFASFVDRHRLRGRPVLEVGCGRGEYLSLVAQAGADAFGIEFSPESVEHCRSLGLAASVQYIENADTAVDGAPFDAFFILSFLEHLPDAVEVLAGIANNLTEGGVGLVEVPNFDMILKNGLFSEFINDHLFYFDRETLCATLGRFGFEVLDCRPVWHDYILSAEVRKRRRLDLSPFERKRRELKKEFRRFFDRFPEKSVVLWGAGHQAFAMLSLLDLSRHLRYVVDSAAFKQHRFTPATHLPIRPPAALRDDPPRAVLVMAGSYSDEIAKLLRRDYDPALTVAVFRENRIVVD